MDDPHEQSTQASEIKHVLPDVVHSQHIPAVGGAVTGETETQQGVTGRCTEGENPSAQDVEVSSETESISEHIPSKMEYSISESDNMAKTSESQGLLKDETSQEKITLHSSLNIPCAQSPVSDNPSTHDPSRQSASWPMDALADDLHRLSEESPVNLALSSDLSKELSKADGTIHQPELEQLPQAERRNETPQSDHYLDSLNEESSHKSNISVGGDNSLDKSLHSDKSSGSEEIIKLDIRGQGVPKFPFPATQIIFGPPPEGSNIISPEDTIPVFPNLLSPFLVGAGESGLKVEEVFDDTDAFSKDPSLERTPELSPSKENSPDQSMTSDKQSLSSDKVEQDVLVEEVIVDYDMKEREADRIDDASIPTQPKSMAPEETTSFSTLTTDYKTICEEYHVKLVHLEDALTQRDELIEELTISLQQSTKERDELRTENVHLNNEVHNLQHIVAEHSNSDHDTVKGQLSDFVKYETMIQDDTTKFYSAIMSGGSSVKSSNGEKDHDHEEITINHSRSDLKSSSSDDFQTGFENKIGTIISKFDEYIEENLRNKLRESIIQVLCTEIGKMRIESDTEIKELESQMQQDKQAYTVETRRLRDLLASVKSGNADIETLKEELNIKHEKEMENLRTYFEKKCSDMERSYSEEVWRGRVCASPLGSASSLEGVEGVDPCAAGDCAHAPRRTRSADLPSLHTEPTQLEQLLKQSNKKYEQQIEELKAEHLTYINDIQQRHAEAITALEEQIKELKAHIQTSENTEQNVSVYQQDIDLELEKERQAFEKRLEDVRQEVVQQLQEQIQVLLSDPDAEVSSWPVELVALRDKIQLDANKQEKEVSSLREELSGGEGGDKWKQRRNFSFDQNRHLEEVTKERDGLKRVAVTLQRVVSQLVSYCACAEDELNKTVLAKLLTRLHHDESTILEEDSRPSTPNLSTNLDSSTVSVSRRVHFAPDLNSLLTDLDEEGLVAFLNDQRDLSQDIKRELEISLKRLRHEAHELLELSARLATKRIQDPKAEDVPQVRITELVDEIDERNKSCDNCQMHRKNMEEAMAECLQRENLLRSDLEAAMIKIAQLMTSNDRGHSSDLIAEGYGTVPPLVPPLSLPCRPPPLRSPPSAPLSLDGGSPSPRAHLSRLAHDLDQVQKERDDLQQQLEAANRQLRSTRQFVEEQAGERESERDEFARRLAELRDENARLATRLQNNARILSEMHCLRRAKSNRCTYHAQVDQLEAQTREMNQIITELEERKVATDEELKSKDEKISLLRDIISNLENQLEQKATHEVEILEELETMKRTIDDRDSKMRSLLGELESLKSERVEQSDVMCVKCGQDENKYEELMEKVKEQCRCLEEAIHRRTQRMERIHEVCSTSCSEPSEDVSIREHKNRDVEPKSPPLSPPPLSELPDVPSLSRVWDGLAAHARADEMAVKRIHDLEMQRAQLKDIAQEVRAERDVLQARMSEQALKISSLSARLQQQRNDAEALAHQASSQLSVQLHDALAEVQRMKEELEYKDKQLARAKQNLEERDKLNNQHHSLYGNSCNPKDKVIILERELSSAQSRIGQLESLVRSLEQDKDELQAVLRDHQRALAEKEDQLHEILALNLEENQKEEKDETEPKASARTLSDIVSISDFDEQDQQMRRAELRNLNASHLAPVHDTSKTPNKTIPPEVIKANMSSLIEYGEHLDITSFTPRADSLPAHLTSTQNKDLIARYKRNVNETTVFGTIDRFGDSVKHSTAQNIPDNCSLYPNKDASASKDMTVEPKKINFSIEASNDNRDQDDEFTSLRELGITLDIRQENFPDILTQLKHEIKKSRTELDNCKSELKNAEEQLCEFPALKEEVEELKGLLENTMATMENDKKFYENQLENFSSNKKLLEQRLTELTQEVNDKSKDLHLLKEDILRRENMILELAKEKRNLTNKMTELEVKIDELQSRNALLEKYESENRQMHEKVIELQKVEQIITEKNQQIDSLNQHLDRLDDLQRNLNDKTEEFDNLREAFEEKSNELFNLQDTVEALNRDIAKLNDDNNLLIANNKDLKLKLTKLEKEQDNASSKLHSSEVELGRLNSLNKELTSKIEELKLLTDKMKDKETEVEILNEDIKSYHDEIASLKEQLKMVSRSPSPRSKSGEERRPDRQASSDKKQLAKIRKQISLMQHELDFNKKELNDKAFELAKAKLDVTELTNNLSQATKQVAEREAASNEVAQRNAELMQQLRDCERQRDVLQEQLHNVVARIREESNISELQAKLRAKSERCQELETEVQDLKDLVDRLRMSPSHAPATEEKALVLSGSHGGRSPTAELERALRDQLNYSHTLDEDIMEQILSASSDEREDIPRLALNTSKSSSSIHSSSSERLHRLRSENEKLQMQVDNLEARLKDKDALITELNRVRDKLVQEWQASKLRCEAERDNAGRLQLLLQTQKDTADTLQNQDSNMIQILKKRLESAMQSELELQKKEQDLRARVAQLERQLLAGDGSDASKNQLQHELEHKARLQGEISLLKSKLDVERTRLGDVQLQMEQAKAQHQREIDSRTEQCNALRNELATFKRLKHDSSVELVRAKELLSIQGTTIAELEKKLAAVQQRQRPTAEALMEIESHKTDLAREISALKKCLAEARTPASELQALRVERQQLQDRIEAMEKEALKAGQGVNDDRDQAIRYLHGRCLRLESCRKALVWQKRYLQRVLAGYAEMEKTLRVTSRVVEVSTGKKRFKCIATAVIIVLRMGFLVRRRQHVRALSANCILRPRDVKSTPTSQYMPSTSPPSRDRGGPMPPSAARYTGSLARRVLQQELRLNLPASPTMGDYMRRSPYATNSPREEGFILSSPRGEVATQYLNKLELVSRCLNQAMDSARDVP